MKRYLDFVNGSFTNKVDGVRPNRSVYVFVCVTKYAASYQSHVCQQRTLSQYTCVNYALNLFYGVHKNAFSGLCLSAKMIFTEVGVECHLSQKVLYPDK